MAEALDFENLLREGIEAGQFGGSIELHGQHAMGFARFWDDTTADHVIDIGSGAGLPALILAAAHRRTTWTLIERRGGRAELLQRAVRRLRLADRVSVIGADVATVAWGPHRHSADWVTSRSFGPPAETAELGGQLLRVGGTLIASEPRDTDPVVRWPAEGLAQCGLALTDEWATSAGAYVRLTRVTDAGSDLPRRGARKRLLF